jgi:hypothetical protein
MPYRTALQCSACSKSTINTPIPKHLEKRDDLTTDEGKNTTMHQYDAITYNGGLFFEIKQKMIKECCYK